MKAYLKGDPDKVGEIINVYIAPWGTKRLTIMLEYGTVVDAGAEEFEIVVEEEL